MRRHLKGPELGGKSCNKNIWGVKSRSYCHFIRCSFTYLGYTVIACANTASVSVAASTWIHWQRVLAARHVTRCGSLGEKSIQALVNNLACCSYNSPLFFFPMSISYCNLARPSLTLTPKPSHHALVVSSPALLHSICQIWHHCWLKIWDKYIMEK